MLRRKVHTHHASGKPSKNHRRYKKPNNTCLHAHTHSTSPTHQIIINLPTTPQTVTKPSTSSSTHYTPRRAFFSKLFGSSKPSESSKHGLDVAHLIVPQTAPQPSLASCYNISPAQQSRNLETTIVQRLCELKNPVTGQLLSENDYITSIKDDGKGNVTIKVKLDKHFRAVKQLLQTTLQPLLPTDPTNPNHTGYFKSLRITLADTKDDLESVKTLESDTAVSTSPPKFSPTSLNKVETEQKQKYTGDGSGPRGLSKVKRIVLVYSNKGGVGKTSVAANLAVALSELIKETDSEKIDQQKLNFDKQKLKIGIFDADIYGPSLPSVIDVMSLNRGVINGDGLEITPQNTSPSIDLVQDIQDDTSYMIRPIQAGGIKMMSYGYVTRTKGGGHGKGEDVTNAPAIMRGAMVSPVINELLTRTNWGDLDVLVVDMPPGTSDIHINITQQTKNTSAVIVTTPNKLSFVDVVRCLQLLDQTNIPTISLVQNMTYFIAPEDPTRTKHFIFGERSQIYKEELQSIGAIPTSVDFPILPAIADAADQGLPLTMKYLSRLRHHTAPLLHPEPQNDAIRENQYGTMIDETIKLFSDLARDVNTWSSPAVRGFIARDMMSLTFDRGSHTVNLQPTNQKPGIIDPTAHLSIDPFKLRIACGCAGCKHEFSGKPLIDIEKVPREVFPTLITPLGSYGAAVQWSDGHSGSVYTWNQLKTTFGPGGNAEKH